MAKLRHEWLHTCERCGAKTDHAISYESPRDGLFVCDVCRRADKALPPPQCFVGKDRLPEDPDRA